MNFARGHPKCWFLLSYSHCLNFSWNRWFPQNYGLSEVTIYTLGDNLVSSLYWEHISKSSKVIFLFRRTSKEIRSLKYIPMSERSSVNISPILKLTWPLCKLLSTSSGVLFTGSYFCTSSSGDNLLCSRPYEILCIELSVYVPSLYWR